jgi:curved DNA-binding protein CbpA
MYFQSETAIFNACRILFGQEVNLSREFLNYLQPSGAKTAFRNQAKAHHPDAHPSSSMQARRQQTERFREIRQAYDLINDFLEKRQKSQKVKPARRPSRATSYRDGRTTSRKKPHSPRPATVPSIPLEFGMYAYYKGKVSYQQLIEALVWQRRQRPTLGAIAEKWGWLSEAKVAEVIVHRGHAVRFGRKAVELGYLKSHQVEALLQHQRSLQKRIGQYFIEKGLLTKEEADQISRNLTNHNQKLTRHAKSRLNKGC